jgi:hypothetical protein
MLLLSAVDLFGRLGRGGLYSLTGPRTGSLLASGQTARAGLAGQCAASTNISPLTKNRDPVRMSRFKFYIGKTTFQAGFW